MDPAVKIYRTVCYIVLGTLFGLGLNWPLWAIMAAMVVGAFVARIQSGEYWPVTLIVIGAIFSFLGLLHVGHFMLAWAIVWAICMVAVLFFELFEYSWLYREYPIHG